jgi:hypothetical protein
VRRRHSGKQTPDRHHKRGRHWHVQRKQLSSSLVFLSLQKDELHDKLQINSYTEYWYASSSRLTRLYDTYSALRSKNACNSVYTPQASRMIGSSRCIWFPRKHFHFVVAGGLRVTVWWTSFLRALRLLIPPNASHSIVILSSTLYTSLDPGPVLHGTKWLLCRPYKQSPTFHSKCGINRGLIKKGDAQ